MKEYLPLLFPLLILCLAGWNLYEETVIRYLHKKGICGTGVVKQVKRTLVKDNRKRAFSKSDMANTYDSKCEYIMTIAYNDGVKERVAKDMVVTDDIRVSGRLLYSNYAVEDEIPLRYSAKLKKCVVDKPKVIGYECSTFKYVCWVFCFAVAVLLMIGMAMSVSTL